MIAESRSNNTTLAPRIDSPRKPKTQVNESGMIAPPTIVIAEDDSEMLTILCEVLEDEGYQVFPIDDGEKLADCLRTGRWHGQDVPFDLVISDIRMPGETGLDVLEELRQRDWATPVILITAFGDLEAHDESRRLGANVLLDKPFDMDDLLTIVKRVVPPSS